MDTRRRMGEDRPVRSPQIAVAAAVVALVACAPAQAAWSGDVSGTTATLTGDGANDLLEIETSGMFLWHSALGAGYSSNLDWNSSPAITETIPLSAQLQVVIHGEDGD